MRAPLTKYEPNVGARIPVRYQWCHLCGYAVLRRDHHCGWVSCLFEVPLHFMRILLIIRLVPSTHNISTTNQVRNCVGVGNAMVFHVYIVTAVVSVFLFGYSSAVWLAARSPQF